MSGVESIARFRAHHHAPGSAGWVGECAYCRRPTDATHEATIYRGGSPSVVAICEDHATRMGEKHGIPVPESGR